MRRLAGCLAVCALVLGAGLPGHCADAEVAAGVLNVRDFAGLVVDGDWSDAIQGAIDSVRAENSYEQGTTIHFPPGAYRVSKTLKLGKLPGHYGTRLSGYGAVLLGTKALDEQPLDHEARKAALTEAKDQFSLDALPGELDFEGKNVGTAILELWCPPGPGTEGASFVIEGLTFDREQNGRGVGIKIPAETVPKNVTFRDIKVHAQNVGVHINHCYQIRFESCIIRGNQIGIWGRNHFNSVGILNSSIRRQHLHGIVIGPNVQEWGCTGIYVAGCIFEETKGYGILNAGGNAVSIVGNYFEGVGNSIGVLTPYWSTSIDTNSFQNFYGYGWNINKHRGQVVADKAHIVVDSPNVQLRNNKYYGQPILVFGVGAGSTFDAQPVVAPGAGLPDGLKVGDSAGLGAYVYSALTEEFAHTPFVVPTQSPDEVLLSRVVAARKALAEAQSADDKVSAQCRLAGIWLEQGDFAQARQEYAKAFLYPAADQLHLRAYIQMMIADSYMQEKDYAGAVAAYEKALGIGPGGWHRDHCDEGLAKARELSAGPQP